MGELLDQFIIELKNLAKALSIEEVKEEPHHSEPYNQPRGQISQVMTNIRANEQIPLRSVIDGDFSPYEPREYNYLRRIEKPVRERP